MNDETVDGVRWSFWVIGGVTLVWNIMGAMNFVVQMNADMVAAMPDTHRAIIESRPAWATAGFGFGVFGGTLGCLLFLLRKSAAKYLFMASLLGVIVTMVHTLRVANSEIDFGLFEVSMMILIPLLVAALLLWYSMYAENREWIR
jgi:hypothetical protein